MSHIFTTSVNKIGFPDTEFKGYWINNYVDVYFNDTDYFRFYVKDYFPGVYKGNVTVIFRDGIATITA